MAKEHQRQQLLEHLGSDSATYTINSVTTSQNGTFYRAVFTNSAGSATTAAATLTVQSGSGIAAPVVTAHQSSVNDTAGQTITVDSAVTVSSSDANLTGATVTIGTGLTANNALHFTNQNGISGVYANGVLSLSGSATPAQYQTALRSVTFSSTSTSTAARTISIVALDGTLISTPATEQVDVLKPVQVTGVYVKGGTAWSNIDSYFSTHSLGSSTLGYALKAGSSELTDLPWSTITTISVAFSQSVNVAGGVSVAANSMALVGGTGTGAATVPSLSSFTTSGNTATWVFSSALGENRYVLAVASTGSAFGTPVTNAQAAGLDGEFTTSSSSLPSGNGLAGGQFNFFFNILPGDTSQAAIVSSTSASTIGKLNNTTFASSGYNPYADIDGSGIINATDSGVESHYNNKTLNTLTAPTAPAVVVVANPDFAILALAVQDTGSSSTNTTPAISNVLPTGSSSAGTTSAITTNTSGITGSGSTESTSSNGHHGRHQFTATDQALLDFNSADLYI